MPAPSVEVILPSKFTGILMSIDRFPVLENSSVLKVNLHVPNVDELELRSYGYRDGYRVYLKQRNIIPRFLLAFF